MRIIKSDLSVPPPLRRSRFSDSVHHQHAFFCVLREHLWHKVRDVLVLCLHLIVWSDHFKSKAKVKIFTKSGSSLFMKEEVLGPDSELPQDHLSRTVQDVYSFLKTCSDPDVTVLNVHETLFSVLRQGGRERESVNTKTGH